MLFHHVTKVAKVADIAKAAKKSVNCVCSYQRPVRTLMTREDWMLTMSSLVVTVIACVICTLLMHIAGKSKCDFLHTYTFRNIVVGSTCIVVLGYLVFIIYQVCYR